MKIKRLEIIGFKSFVDKVTLDFPHGVTAVVGPNGCGKSNIVDAIRWVMGEQSARNLRGKTMEDIIFSGCESRKALGMAEVSLIFSAEDGRVPAKYLNFSEIQVTRRIYRDGESEFFLNKTPCRLMDITELFMDTGVGARAYSIIEQGRIGMILLSKPEERRFLIEEAAGVSKFKARKQMAIKKIDISRQNLLRIGDIIGELKRQLSSLQRQAKKAEKFRACREELKEIEVSFAANNFLLVEGELKRIKAELAVLEAEATSVLAELEKGDLALEEKGVVLLEEEKMLSLCQEALYRIRGEVQASENRLEYRNKEMHNLDQRRERLAEEMAALQRQAGDAEAELKILEERRSLYASEISSEESALSSGEESLDELVRGESGLAIRLEKTRNELFSLLSEIAQLGNQQTAVTRRLEALNERFVRSSREKVAFQEKLAHAGGRCAELQMILQKLSENKGKLAEELTGEIEHEEGLKKLFESAELELIALRAELGKKNSRLHSLEELEAQFAGYGQGVRNLLLSERFKERFNGVVADLLEVDEAYELAIEALLGEKLQYVVCPGDQDALAAIDFLKETSGGRCSLLPEGLAATGPVQSEFAGEKLLNKITIGDRFKNVLQPLFADTYIVNDIIEALQLSRRYPGLTFVTLQGDIAGGGGIISGGSSDVVQQGLVHKKREIKELRRNIPLLSEKLQEKVRARDHVKNSINSSEENIRCMRQKIHEAEISIASSDKDFQLSLAECRGLEERLALRGLEDDQLREEAGTLHNEIESTSLKRSADEALKADLESETTRLHEIISMEKKKITDLREVVTGMKVRSAALREKRESNLRSISRVEGIARDLQSRINGHGSELIKCEEDHRTLSAMVVEDEEERGRLMLKVMETEASVAAMKNKFEEAESIAREEEGRLKRLRGSYEEFRQSAGEKNIKYTELSMKLQNLENILLEKYRLEISTVLLDYQDISDNLEDHRARQIELQRMIDDIGEVNLMAIDEYRELEERFAFLTAQKEDLEESLRSLQKAIQRINKTTRKRFLETFQLVNAKFQEVFPRLFCGGRAELKLTNEEDLLETGIEIIVQPPGKKLQNVSLLSGGEKALTAVALIFSIFLIKPSPFCLLDEVDAPLDDANIGRFNEMVREMTEFSQFIVITHNKATMSVADTLFGITMEEPGVSKLVSVKLNT